MYPCGESPSATATGTAMIAIAQNARTTTARRCMLSLLLRVNPRVDGTPSTASLIPGAKMLPNARASNQANHWIEAGKTLSVGSGDYWTAPPGVIRPASAIHLATMTYHDDHNRLIGISHGVEDAVVSLAHTVEIVTRELLASGRTRIARKLSDPGDEAPAVLLGQGFEFLCGRCLDEQPIACHGA